MIQGGTASSSNPNRSISAASPAAKVAAIESDLPSARPDLARPPMYAQHIDEPAIGRGLLGKHLIVQAGNRHLSADIVSLRLLGGLDDVALLLVCQHRCCGRRPVDRINSDLGTVQRDQHSLDLPD